jgi:Amt family ammonium transporter
MKKTLIGLFAMLLFLMPAAFAQEIDTGDIAWVSVAAALVMLMTPAVGFFYAGLVRRKNVVSILVQSLVIFAIVSLVWTVVGYSLAFGPSIGGIVGDLSFAGLKGVDAEPDTNYAGTIPATLFFFFQLMFATITPALIIGSFAERIRFRALVIFTVLWSALVYAPIAHWVWNPGGWLRGLGALDFAGGTVVHAASGLSALAAAIVIGRRKEKSDAEFKPNNVPFVILGAVLLWFGWFGFNAGSALAANGLAVSALVVTNIAAAAGAVSWMAVDRLRKGKPSAVGMAIGAVAGLVAITPASGFVSVWPAILIGLVAGVISNLVANWRAARTKIDDSLDVFACHGVSGVWGALATGLFASVAVNSAGANGLFYGNANLIVSQLIACGAVIVYAFAATFIIMKGMSVVMNLRVSKEEEELGLDVAAHGEPAYT